MISDENQLVVSMYLKHVMTTYCLKCILPMCTLVMSLLPLVQGSGWGKYSHNVHAYIHCENTWYNVLHTYIVPPKLVYLQIPIWISVNKLIQPSS